MVWLANFALKGYSQAILSISVALLLTLVFPPVFWLSSALIGFLIYQRNEKEILKVIAFVLIFSFLVLQFSLGAGFVAIALALLWLPVSAAVYVAKKYRAYSLGVELLVLFALLVAALTILVAGDLQQYWKELIRQMLEQQGNKPVDQQMQLIIDSIGKTTTGWVISGALLGSLLSYFLAGFWNKVLTEKPALDLTFGNLRVSQLLTLVGIAVLLASFSQWLVIENMVPTVIVGFSLIGVAIVHQLILIKTNNTTWLLGFYFLLILLFGELSLFLAMIGLSDYWMHYRNKLVKNT